MCAPVGLLFGYAGCGPPIRRSGGGGLGKRESEQQQAGESESRKEERLVLSLLINEQQRTDAYRARNYGAYGGVGSVSYVGHWLFLNPQSLCATGAGDHSHTRSGYA